MKRRNFLSVLLIGTCIAALWGVSSQRQQLVNLRAEQQLLAQALSAASQPAAAAPTASGPPVSLELLRLRSEVTRLGERKRALAGVTNENERLRVQIASDRTNSSAGVVLPPGYMRKNQARMVGYGTPEDTLQSLLWANQNHDLASLMQAYTPEMAQRIQAQVQQSKESAKEFWQDREALIGFRVLDRKQEPDGSVTLSLEILPGNPQPDEAHFRLIGSQWKLDSL